MTASRNPALQLMLQSRRKPSAQELAAIPWLASLKPADQRLAHQALEIGDCQQGDLVCMAGKPVRYWLGVVDGLLKMSNHRADGSSISYAGLPTGSWFGEGTALKREHYRYDIQALRNSTLAVLPVDTFHTLLDRSIEFNRTIMNQLSERVGQFITSRETDRMNSPDSRVARTLAALVNPILAPSVDNTLRITQQELAYLVGLSRQRVNMALVKLSQQGLIGLEYGGLQVLDRHALAEY